MKCCICEEEFTGLICVNKHCHEEYIECPICKKIVQYSQSVEYRGFISCCDCQETMIEKRDRQRAELIAEQDQVDKALAPLVEGSVSLGMATNDIFARHAKKQYGHRASLAKQTLKRKAYENGEM